MRNAGVMATVAFFAIVLCFAPVVHPQQGQGPPAGLLAELQAQIDALQTRVETLEDLTQFQIVVPGEINGLAGPHLIFEGVNLHIESGSGSTDDGGSPSGLGNLVVGYNEEPFVLLAGDRDGSHNIVLGPEHKYLSTGGFVAGERNTISGLSASVGGGFVNVASGLASSVSGGIANTADGSFSSVSGGRGNGASGSESSVSGGLNNTASGIRASVSGGVSNLASGGSSSVSGGISNTASRQRSSVSGGRSNTAIGGDSSVSGGRSRTAPGSDDWVAGSLFQPN